MANDNQNQLLYVSNILREIFGINSPVYFPYGSKEQFTEAEYNNITFLPQNKYESKVYQSEFNTPVLGAITFEGGGYNVYDRTTAEINIQRMQQYTLPYSCIVSFSRDNNVTKTQILGNTGTVKEVFGVDDWNISIKGIALDPRSGKGLTAHEQIDILTKWCSLADSIPVLGSMFAGKSITNIVIESFMIQPIVGRWGAIPFQIEAVSDEPIELILG